MIRIFCPHCGHRDHSEFTYFGDATVKRPSDTAPGSEWSEYVYQRDNPRGKHEELWHHGMGCRSWLVVTRDTLTHKITASRLARDKGGRR